MADSEPLSGFCSGADEDDLSLHSPSASEDSVEVNVTAISSLRNKRKLVEPRKVEDLPNNRPLKKRRRFDTERSLDPQESRSLSTPSPCPFRPWSDDRKTPFEKPKNPMEDEVLSRLRVKPDNLLIDSSQRRLFPRHLPPPTFDYSVPVHSEHQEEPLSLVLREPPRVPPHPAVSEGFERPPCSLSSSSSTCSGSTSGRVNTKATTTTTSMAVPLRHQQPSQQRNYKNMTRERRIEANARERTRVHTISAAFETLRKSIPAYSHNQKLSKLSVLRIACSYIMTLGKILEDDDDQGRVKGKESLEACVDMVSRTIQTEGKLRKKKDD